VARPVRSVRNARSGDMLIVWKLDCLARPMRQLIATIKTLRGRGIGFRSLTEALDTTTAKGRRVFHMFDAVAEFARRLIRAPRRTLPPGGAPAAPEQGRRNSPTTTSRPTRRSWPIPASA
jgi:DNA invertase Pin-like site-specific DNA recombinase